MTTPFTDKYTWVVETPNPNGAPNFIAFAENIEECVKEVEKRIEEIELLSAEVSVKISMLFQEVQKAICFTQTAHLLAGANSVSLRSEISGLQYKLRDYLKHVYDCSDSYASFTQYMTQSR